MEPGDKWVTIWELINFSDQGLKEINSDEQE